jgi:hypothetical protein
MTVLDDGFGGYLILFLAGFFATEIWRWLGLMVGSRLDVAEGPFLWVSAVATALVAGLVTRMVLFPAGALAAVPLGVRLGALVGGLALYFLLGRNLALGVAGGTTLLAGAQLLFQ